MEYYFWNNMAFKKYKYLIHIKMNSPFFEMATGNTDIKLKHFDTTLFEHCIILTEQNPWNGEYETWDSCFVSTWLTVCLSVSSVLVWPVEINVWVLCKNRVTHDDTTQKCFAFTLNQSPQPPTFLLALN